MSMRTGSQNLRPLIKHPAILIAATGLALGVATDAGAVARMRIVLGVNQQESPSNGQGDTVVVGNIDAGHVWDAHGVFGDRVVRVWFAGNDVPAVPNAGQVRGMFYSAHATAAASALAGNSWTIPSDDPGIYPRQIDGFAPDAPIILSAGFATHRNEFGALVGGSNTAIAFAIFALTDPQIASYAANLLQIDPYPVASVVNASFGSVTSTNDRRGESLVAHAFDAAAWHNDATIVVAAGDFREDPLLEELMTLPGYQGGTAAAPGTAFNVLTVSRLNESLSNADSDSSEGPVGIVDWRAAGITMISSISPAVWQTPCTDPQGLATEMPNIRSVIHLTAPGTLLTLAGHPGIDPPNDFPQGDADNAFNTLWEGTSFASAITAGVAALAHDVGYLEGIWAEDENGVPRPSGLVTRAILINSALRTGNFPTPTIQEENITGAEGAACIVSQPLDESIGSGTVNPAGVREQLLANQARDIKPGEPFFVDGFERYLVGFERSTYTPTIDDPTDIFRDPPPIFNPTDIFVETSGPHPQGYVPPGPGFIEQEEGWFTGWDPENVNEANGTDPKRPFVTYVETNVDSNLPSAATAAAAPAPFDHVTPVNPSSLPTPAPAPRTSRTGDSEFRELGQPGLEFPDHNLDDGGRGPIFPGTPGIMPGLGFGGGGGNGGPPPSPGLRKVFGWDHGRMGAGHIDYPIGFMTANGTIRATLVWNRTEVWRESDLNSWASSVGFRTLQAGKIEPYIRTIFPANFPTPIQSEDGFELPTFQRAFAMENLDLEIWRRNAFGIPDTLIGSSRSEWGTVEHLSVGPGSDGGMCEPDFGMLAGSYFIRVRYINTLFDLGGYRYCGDFQSLQMKHFNSDNVYENLYPAEVEFALAWSAQSPRNPSVLGLMDSDNFQPVDMDNNGVIDDLDIVLMVQSVMGDLNTDGVINSVDLSILLSKFGTNELQYDLNFDGAVNGADIAFLLARFGNVPLP